MMGKMVVYQSILEPFEPLETLTFIPTTFESSLYIQEAYCSNPVCDCQEAYLAFHQLDQDGRPIEELFRFRLDLVEKGYKDLEVKKDSIPYQELIQEFMANLDEFYDDIKRHYDRIKEHFRTHIPDDLLPRLYRQYQKKEYVEYHELFSGQILNSEGMLIVDSYRLDDEEEPTVQLRLVHAEEGTSIVRVNLHQRSYEIQLGHMNKERLENILNGPIYQKLIEHNTLMKEAGKKVRKAGIRLGKVGRNEPCPCGSGKKFKYCHGR